MIGEPYLPLFDLARIYETRVRLGLLLNERRDTGIFLPGHASSPQPRLPSRPVPGLTLSMGRSVADIVSAHVPGRKIPASRLGCGEF